MPADRLAKRGRSLKHERSADDPKRSSDLFGTPEEVVDRIHQLRADFGADEIMCTMLGWRSTREDVLNSIRLISEKVIPEVSSRLRWRIFVEKQPFKRDKQHMTKSVLVTGMSGLIGTAFREQLGQS